MLSLKARGFFGIVVNPFAALLARTRLDPDVITVVGTLGTVAASVTMLATGHFFVGVLVVTVCVLTDMIDGALARARGATSTWGALLDSTMDRVGDGAIFGSLVYWFAGRGDAPVLAALALFCLVAGAVVSYVKARAEGLGLECNVGFAERAERLIIVLVGTGLDGLGVRYVLALALWFLAAASLITVAQRFVEVRRQVAPR